MIDVCDLAAETGRVSAAGIGRSCSPKAEVAEDSIIGEIRRTCFKPAALSASTSTAPTLLSYKGPYRGQLE